MGLPKYRLFEAGWRTTGRVSLLERGDFGIPIQGLRPQCRVLRPVLRLVLRRLVLSCSMSYRAAAPHYAALVWPIGVLPHTALRLYGVTEVSPLRGWLAHETRCKVTISDLKVIQWGRRSLQVT